MVSVQAKRTGHASTLRVEASTAVGSLAKPELRVDRGLGRMGSASEPQTLAQRIEGARESRSVVDMSLEMVDVYALDTGKYHALVIQDPADKRNVRGFCHLAILFSRALYANPSEPGYSFDHYIMPAFMSVPAAMNEYTDIKTDVLGRLAMDDPRIFRAPWLLFAAHDRLPRPGIAELESLGRYLTSGGFVFADCHNYWNKGNTPAYSSLRDILLDALAAQGVNLPFEKIPNDHSIYHCYFDFDGPPAAGDAGDDHPYPDLVHIIRYLEGIEIDGRLAVLLSGKHLYKACLYSPTYRGIIDPRRAAQFVVNTIVFALTQEGSITHRLMESVR